MINVILILPTLFTLFSNRVYFLKIQNMPVSASFDSSKMLQREQAGNEAYTWFNAYKYANVGK
jgi:hypothetical protein